MCTSSELRSQALQAACRAVLPGQPVGHFFSTARAFHQYLLTGLSQTGANGRQGLEVGKEGVLVRVDGRISDEQAVALRTAIDGVLR